MYASERVISMGGKAGWSLVDDEQNFRITVRKGRYGYDCMMLDTNSRPLSSDTDLLIDFEGDDPVDMTGNYSIVDNAILPTDSAKMGKGAGL